MTVTGCDHHGPSGIITKALWAPSHRSWHGGDVSLDLEKGVKNNTIGLSYIHLHPPTSFVKLVELVESQNETHSLAGLGTIFCNLDCETCFHPNALPACLRSSAPCRKNRYAMCWRVSASPLPWACKHAQRFKQPWWLKFPIASAYDPWVVVFSL